MVQARGINIFASRLRILTVRILKAFAFHRSKKQRRPESVPKLLQLYARIPKLWLTRNLKAALIKSQTGSASGSIRGAGSRGGRKSVQKHAALANLLKVRILRLWGIQSLQHGGIHWVTGLRLIGAHNLSAQFAAHRGLHTSINGQSVFPFFRGAWYMHTLTPCGAFLQLVLCTMKGATAVVACLCHFENMIRKPPCCRQNSRLVGFDRFKVETVDCFEKCWL